MGDPEPAFGFSRILRVLLEQRYPDRQIEVINTAFPAISSSIIREIARDSAPARADFWILYVGNNEVLGPHGLTTAFGTSKPNPAADRAAAWLRRFRLGQWLTEQGQLPEAARQFKEVLRVDPVNSVAQHFLAPDAGNSATNRSMMPRAPAADGAE